MPVGGKNAGRCFEYEVKKEESLFQFVGCYWIMSSVACKKSPSSVVDHFDGLIDGARTSNNAMALVQG